MAERIFFHSCCDLSVETESFTQLCHDGIARYHIRMYHVCGLYTVLMVQLHFFRYHTCVLIFTRLSRTNENVEQMPTTIHTGSLLSSEAHLERFKSKSVFGAII